MAAAVDVSVVVPCYNTERFLDQALTSAEQNAAASLEIIVLDDGSTDGSARIMDVHAARDGRVCVIHKENEGYGATVNKGIDAARGTYVAVLEPDDYVLPRAYDELYRFCFEQGLPDVAKTPYWRVQGAGDADGARAHGYLKGRVGRHGSPFTLADEPELIRYHPSVWSALYKRSFLDREGIRFVEAPGAGWVDNPFSVEALAAAERIAYRDVPFYCYREDLAGASSAAPDPLLMCRRWHERQDALERRGCTSRDILLANLEVGLRFLSSMEERGVLEDAAVREAVSRMARRFDADLLVRVRDTSPHTVATARALAGLAPQDAGRLASMRWLAHLAHEASWALVTNGPVFTLSNIVRALGR